MVFARMFLGYLCSKATTQMGLVLFLGDRTDCLFCVAVAHFLPRVPLRLFVFNDAVVLNGVFLAMTNSAVAGIP